MSEIKVNKISPRTACGTTVLGDSGDTISIPAGVTITNSGTANGFGADGAVNWQTSIKTANFTATSGEGYFCDTASVGAFTLTLPSSPSVGDIVALKDYASNFATANLTVGRGGSNMNGNAGDFTASTDNLSLTLVYADATKGWLAVEEGTGFVGEAFITATGGTETTSGNDKIHTFTGPGSFTVCSAATCAANNLVSYLVVAGGGGGGGDYGAGAGAGGYREVVSPSSPYTGSPLNGYPSSPNRVTVSATSYPITIGSGGNKGTRDTLGTDGSASVFSTITSAGGGRGGMQVPGSPSSYNGGPGGSGGGACYDYDGSGNTTAGSGNTPPTTPAQGSNGGTGFPTGTGGHAGGGGGGAGAVGATVPGGDSAASGAGGNGVTSEITASPVARGGGGGGAGGGGTHGQDYNPGPGGTGGGGAGAADSGSGVGGAGTANTGGGGGGGNLWTPTSCGGNGGSGVVVIRYKYQ